jgi:uncharacterized protein with FMN-binding domain
MPMKRRGSSRKVAPGLVALSSAAILAIYAAGFVRTRAASERFADDGAKRRVGSPPEASPVVLPEAPLASVRASSSTRAGATFVAQVTKAETRAARVGPSRHASSPASPAAATPASEADGAETSMARISAAPPTANLATIISNLATKDVPAGPTAAPTARYKDGTFSGWGTSRHGDIQATVVVEGGRIASAVISQCLTRYSCSWIANLPPQVVGRQSADVDYVSGATQSTNAFYYAVLEALSKAK